MIEYSYRVATQDDIQAITDIYNAAVIRGGSSADITPRTYKQRKAWVESHHDPYAVFVTETVEDDGTRQIIDSARFPFSTIAQDTTASPISPTISIRNGRAGESAHTHSPNCLEECRKRNMRKACGIIFADNAGSIALMKRFGFTHLDSCQPQPPIPPAPCAT